MMRFGEYRKSTEAQEAGSYFGQCLRELGLAAGLNQHKVFEAWDNFSHAGRYTIRRSLSKGTLYISLSSSVIRSELSPVVDSIRGKINQALRADPMYTKGKGEAEPVKKIILQ